MLTHLKPGAKIICTKGFAKKGLMETNTTFSINIQIGSKWEIVALDGEAFTIVNTTGDFKVYVDLRIVEMLNSFKYDYNGEIFTCTQGLYLNNEREIVIKAGATFLAEGHSKNIVKLTNASTLKDKYILLSEKVFLSCFKYGSLNRDNEITYDKCYVCVDKLIVSDVSGVEHCFNAGDKILVPGKLLTDKDWGEFIEIITYPAYTGNKEMMLSKKILFKHFKRGDKQSW